MSQDNDQQITFLGQTMAHTLHSEATLQDDIAALWKTANLKFGETWQLSSAQRGFTADEEEACLCSDDRHYALRRHGSWSERSRKML